MLTLRLGSSRSLALVGNLACLWLLLCLSCEQFVLRLLANLSCIVYITPAVQPLQ